MKWVKKKKKKTTVDPLLCYGKNDKVLNVLEEVSKTFHGKRFSLWPIRGRLPEKQWPEGMEEVSPKLFDTWYSLYANNFEDQRLKIHQRELKKYSSERRPYKIVEEHYWIGKYAEYLVQTKIKDMKVSLRDFRDVYFEYNGLQHEVEVKTVKKRSLNVSGLKDRLQKVKEYDEANEVNYVIVFFNRDDGYLEFECVDFIDRFIKEYRI